VIQLGELVMILDLHRQGLGVSAIGVSLRSVQRVWGAHRLQPHRVRRF
jgi:hypothetical protein